MYSLGESYVPFMSLPVSYLNIGGNDLSVFLVLIMSLRCKITIAELVDKQKTFLT